MKITNKMYYID